MMGSILHFDLHFESTIKRHLYECKHRRFTTRCKPLVPVMNRKARLDFAINIFLMFRNQILWADVTKINMYQNDWNKKYVKEIEPNATNLV